MAGTHTNASGAVLIIVTSLEGVPLVRDPKHSRPRWKIPGGTVEPGETHAQAAMRELKEETGLDLTIGDEDRICSISRKDHVKTVYHVDVPSFLKGLRSFGEEGEEVRIFSIKEARAVVVHGHRELLTPPIFRV